MNDGARLLRNQPFRADRGRGRGPSQRALSALLLALILAGSLPVGVSAAHFWTVGTSTASVTQHVSTGVTLTAQNTSTNDGGGDSIGCVRIWVPGAYDVDSVTVDSVSRGFSWSVSTSGVAPTLVTFKAADDSNRLRGDPSFDVLTATITVTGNTVGTFDWTATEYEKPDCSQEQLTQVLPMSIATGVNAAPTATADAYSVVAGTTLSAAAPGVLANDSDPDGDPLFATLVGDVSSGVLALGSDGGFTYTPDPGYTGGDAFTYEATDGSLSSGVATATLTVTNVVPTTTADSYAASKNVLLTVPAAAGVLANDTDADTAAGQPFSAILETAPASGTLNLAADGGFTFDPPANATGVFTFTYRAFDTVVTTAPETVTLTVSNDAPVATDDGYATHMNDPIIVTAASGLLANDSDANADSLTVDTSPASGPSNGILAIAPDGSFTYSPDLFWTGTDTFTYRVSDGTAWSGPATVTIAVSNGQPTAQDDAASGSHDTTFGGDVLANDLDPDGDPLTASLVTDVSSGVLSLASDGTWSYTPDAGYVGPDAFTYRASDGEADSGIATVTIDVTNATPVAVDDAFSIHHRSTLTRTAPGVMANDTDDDGDALTMSVVTNVAHGTLTPASDGSYTFVPTPGYVGADSFTYTVSDGLSTSAPATVSIAITDTAPIAADDAWSMSHDRTLVVANPGVFGGDSDPDGDPLTVSLVGPPSNGTLAGGTIGFGGGFTYTPAAGFVGTDAFTYRISDGALTASATVTITVTNAAPVAKDDAKAVRHDRTLVVSAPGLLANDTDGDADSLTAALVAAPSHGTASVAANGRLTYTPTPGYVGPDTVTYRASDGLAGDVATVSIDVTNAIPVAIGDRYALVGDGPTTIAAADGVLVNDLDADGDALVASLASGPGNGTVSLSVSGRFTYSPDDGFVGTDSFSYRASDGLAGSAPAVVLLTVSAPPPPAPTPTPSPEPTPEPSPEPSPEPTPESSPSPDPSPTPEATPSPIPTIGPIGPPDGPPADTWSIGGSTGETPGTGGAGRTDLPIANLASSTLGLFGKAFDWLVPGAMVMVPGLLLVVVVLAQMFGALAWLPLVRRKIGGFGFGARPARQGGAIR